VPHEPRTSPAPNAARSVVREEHVTSTGWRLVGADAISLAADAAERSALPVGRDEDVLFAAKFRLRPRIGGGSAVHAALAVLGAAVARDWEDAPPLTRDRSLVRAPARFHGLRWETAGEPGAWRGELVWRRRHPVLAGVPCTTDLLLLEQQAHTELTLRVTADDGLASVRGAVGAGQARPPFLAELNRALRLTFHGGEGEPSQLLEAEIDDFVRDVLLSETREYPVAVLAPLEEGGYAIPPNELAEELLGLARVHAMDRHQATFRLSDTLGDRRLSAYWGALRVYMPEFSCADSGDDHPLLVRDRLVDPVERAKLVGILGRFAGRRVRMPAVATPATAASPTAGAPAVSPAPAAVGEPAAASGSTSARSAPDDAVAASGSPAPPATHRSTPADTPAYTPDVGPILARLPDLLSALGDQIGALAATVARLVESNAALGDEIARLRTTTAVRAAGTSSLERRLGGLEALIERRLAPDDGRAADGSGAADGNGGRTAASLAGTDETDEAEREEGERLTLLEALRQAATAHSDALLVLDAAERAAADSPYEDVERVAVILDAMASIARRRQEGALGVPLRVAFRDMGIEYRGAIARATPDRLLQQYLVKGSDGQLYECREHIVLGTSYDPRYCLRIYFTSRAPVEPRFVIGHVGRHFDVQTTS
jgi:hypothetical protein